MEPYLSDSRRTQQTMIKGTVGTRLDRFPVIRDNEELRIGNALQRPEHLHQFFIYRYLAMRVWCLRGTDDNFRVPFVFLYYIYTFYGSVYEDDSGGDVDVAPLQRTDLADSHAGGQTDVDAEAIEGKMIANVIQKESVFGDTQYFNIFRHLKRRILDVPFNKLTQFQLRIEFSQHLKDDDHVFDTFQAHAVFKFLKHKFLDVLFNNFSFVSESGENVLFENHYIDRIGGDFDIFALFFSPEFANSSDCCVIFHSF